MKNLGYVIKVAAESLLGKARIYFEMEVPREWQVNGLTSDYGMQDHDDEYTPLVMKVPTMFNSFEAFDFMAFSKQQYPLLSSERSRT